MSIEHSISMAMCIQHAEFGDPAGEASCLASTVAGAVDARLHSLFLAFTLLRTWDDWN